MKRCRPLFVDVKNKTQHRQLESNYRQLESTYRALHIIYIETVNPTLWIKLHRTELYYGVADILDTFS